MKKYFRSIFKKITVSLSFLLLAGYLYQCKAETDNVERPRWDDSSASLNSESSPTPVSSLTSAAASSSALDSSAATVSSVQSSSVIPSQKINPCGVSASTNQTTNIPEHTLDGLLNTRWSAEGIGEWIEYDLCQQTTLGSVKISWYNGDLRRSSCEIAVSDNGVSWNIIYSLQSSGTTTALENYDFTDTNASFLRLVGYGNTENNWNSINEVEIWTADDHGTSSSSGSSADSSTSSSGAIVIDQTGFEGYSDEYTFTESTWTAEGFDPRWVNGFDQNRAHIDTAHSCVGNAALRIDYPAGTY
ncbi:MAG TPA: discoidin domain-containing protein, partial [Spirochaetota bacterium]|nr:discoidin domain-containing protein [Spirochaetota bacterium]